MSLSLLHLTRGLAYLSCMWHAGWWWCCIVLWYAACSCLQALRYKAVPRCFLPSMQNPCRQMRREGQVLFNGQLLNKRLKRQVGFVLQVRLLCTLPNKILFDGHTSADAVPCS